jgi:hypothetical protein
LFSSSGLFVFDEIWKLKTAVFTDECLDGYWLKATPASDISLGEQVAWLAVCFHTVDYVDGVFHCSLLRVYFGGIALWVLGA